MEQKEERFFHRVIRELCSEMDIKMEKLSFDWILQLSKDGEVRHITGYYFDNNPQATGTIANDKYATYEVLKSQNVPIIKHTILFNPATEKFIPKEENWKSIANEFLKQGSLVIKPNDGTEGEDVELCHDLKETEIAIQKLFRKNYGTISICPYYDIKTEYRTFYLNGEVLLIYGKSKPFVIGDGKLPLEDLIKTLHLPDKSAVKDNLGILDMSYVPKQGEKVNISWKHNLCNGATPRILEKGEWYYRIESLAKQAGKAMNMKFATIDIIQTKDNELYVLEVNSGVCATFFAQEVDGGYEIAKEIYRKALKAMFE